ncbi:hypothetical protein V5T82_15385 [Magnetovibrio sp. PR-2]|uniref:hypothetical protein n=1 Tax=Magnetovibrio sp. PR-2 TaxID=3120356 RepID=UPI002FCE11B8
MYMVTVGQASPYGALPEGASLIIDSNQISMIVSMPGLMSSEKQVFRNGPMSAGIATLENVSNALFVVKFSGGVPLILDAPFNVCVNEKEHWGTPQRAPHEHVQFLNILQDEKGIVQAVQGVTIPPKLMDTVESVCDAQILASNKGRWSAADYDSDTDKLYSHWPSPMAITQDIDLVKLGSKR